MVRGFAVSRVLTMVLTTRTGRSGTDASRKRLAAVRVQGTREAGTTSTIGAHQKDVAEAAFVRSFESKDRKTVRSIQTNRDWIKVDLSIRAIECAHVFSCFHHRNHPKKRIRYQTVLMRIVIRPILAACPPRMVWPTDDPPAPRERTHRLGWSTSISPGSRTYALSYIQTDATKRRR